MSHLSFLFFLMLVSVFERVSAMEEGTGEQLSNSLRKWFCNKVAVAKLTRSRKSGTVLHWREGLQPCCI